LEKTVEGEKNGDFFAQLQLPRRLDECQWRRQIQSPCKPCGKTRESRFSPDKLNATGRYQHLDTVMPEHCMPRLARQCFQRQKEGEWPSKSKCVVQECVLARVWRIRDEHAPLKWDSLKEVDLWAANDFVTGPDEMSS
jgi:hypothetical protein